MKNLTEYKVKKIKSAHGELMFSNFAMVEDEGSFYRIDGTYILDKHKIKSIEEIGNKIVISMGNEQVALTVE